ncbi:LysR family transcriptional regulator [Hoeflea olei]|uniref:LysR family transcriptional regulator n=1 Tax=Hoeflea olei TaxID=1480615 RepID=A0A1C1YWR7_9HYPH|nr:LysR family transcriptional regulator [Hoeflea olei]OCW57948.1 LysR family transcriptional regulator [Hoeflea olei]
MQPYEQRFPWNLDWNLLRTFMIVVDQRGLTRAADFLGVTQPTISSALKRLETTIGASLIDRRPGHFAVTEAGQVLYQECTALFGAVSQIPGLITKAQRRVTGHITIVMTSHVVCDHLDRVLYRFNEDHPGVTYSISIAESSEVLNRVRQNRATFGVCLMRDPDPALLAQPLYRERFALYCGPRHRLFGKTQIKLSELKGENSVSFQTEVESGPLFLLAQLRERALLDPEVKGVSANLPEVRRMIVAGIGVGALPVHVASRDVAAGLLWPLPPYGGLPTADIYFVTNPRRSLNPAESVLVAAIGQLIETTPIAERTYP